MMKKTNLNNNYFSHHISRKWVTIFLSCSQNNIFRSYWSDQANYFAKQNSSIHGNHSANSNTHAYLYRNLVSRENRFSTLSSGLGQIFHFTSKHNLKAIAEANHSWLEIQLQVGDSSNRLTEQKIPQFTRAVCFCFPVLFPWSLITKQVNK